MMYKREVNKYFLTLNLKYVHRTVLHIYPDGFEKFVIIIVDVYSIIYRRYEEERIVFNLYVKQIY